MATPEWHDFRRNFHDVGYDDDMRGYVLMEKVREWAKEWPRVKIQTVDDALATCSSLVFIPMERGVELLVIPQNINIPTLISITSPRQTIDILTQMTER